MKYHVLTTPLLHYLMCNTLGPGPVVPSSAFTPTTFVSKHQEIIKNAIIVSSPLQLKKNEDSDPEEKRFNVLPKSNAIAPEESESIEQQKMQLREINLLTKQMEQKETAINRLKFQLNELKSAAEESEVKRAKAEEKVDKLTKESDVIKKKNVKEYSKLQTKFSKEKDKMNEQLRSTIDELSQVKSDSQKKLEKSEKRAKAEKEELMGEIIKLQVELDDTKKLIGNAKDQMKSISNNTVLQVEEKMKELILKDEEIQQLVDLRDEYETKIGRLEKECDTLRIALEESEKQKLEVQKKIESLQEQTELTMKADQESISKLKDELSQEKTAFSNQLGSLKEDLQKVKSESEREIQFVKNEASNEKDRLEIQISSLQAELAAAADRIERARKSVFEVRKGADEKLAKMKKDSDNFKDNMRNLSTQEKKELKSRVWDLEFKVNKAKYDLILAQREAEALKTAALDHESQIKALEEAHKEEKMRLEQDSLTKEMFYARSRAENREKTRQMAAEFQNKLQQKENNAISSLETLRQLLLKVFEIQNVRASAMKKETFDEQTAELSATINDAVTKMDERKKSFEDKVSALEKSLADAKESAKRELKEQGDEYELNLKEERKKAKTEKEELITEKNNDIQRMKEEGIRNVSIVRLDLTEKLNASKNEMNQLKKSLEEKNKMIENYEEEKRSYRKLAKLVWKATREKISSRRRRRKPKM